MQSRLAGVLVALVLVSACDGGGTDQGEDDVAVTSTPPLVVPPDDAAGTAGPGSSGATAAPDAAAGTADDASATSSPPPAAVDLADHLTDEVLLEQTGWVLGLLEPGAQGPEVTELPDRFAPEFLDQVPALQLAMVFPGLRAGGPYTVSGVEQVEGLGRMAQLVLHAGEQPLRMTITLDDDDRISGLLFVPDTSGEPPQIGSWDDLDAALTELGGTSQVVVGEVRDGVCTPVHTTAGLEPGGEPAPGGSVFKLMVLAALVEAVEADEIAWDDELTLTEEVKSLPSGILQERETGSTVTVREAAELMISISDNTATDLLIGAVGQARLREAMEAAGVDALRAAPVLTTKELFILGWGVDQEVRDRWARTQVPETRAALQADLPTDLSVVDVAAVTTPVWQDGVDWVLTGGEICSIHARLQQLATTPAGEPVRDILSANPGGEAPDGVSYQGFKGGSAPGVLALSYYVETQAPGDAAAATDEPTGVTGTSGDASADAGTDASADAGTDASADAPDGLVLVVMTRSEEEVDQLRAATIVDAGLRHLVGADH